MPPHLFYTKLLIVIPLSATVTLRLKLSLRRPRTAARRPARAGARSRLHSDHQAEAESETGRGRPCGTLFEQGLGAAPLRPPGLVTGRQRRRQCSTHTTDITCDTGSHTRITCAGACANTEGHARNRQSGSEASVWCLTADSAITDTMRYMLVNAILYIKGYIFVNAFTYGVA